MMQFWVKNKQSIIYGISLALLLFVLKWLELRLIIIDHAFEIYTGAVALIFTFLGIWLATKLIVPQSNTVFIEKRIFLDKEADFKLNQHELEKLALSKRELEVLQLMADGLSNQEIASRLFISLHTIKTHSSKIFEKMEVKRRTQAVEVAKRLQLIP